MAYVVVSLFLRPVSYDERLLLVLLILVENVDHHSLSFLLTVMEAGGLAP